MMNSLAGSIVCTRQLQPFFRRPHVVPRPGAVSRGTWLQHRAASRALRQSTAHVVRAEGATTAPPMTPAITLTDDALKHLHKLRAESGGEALLLRIGVKSGGCSGMSYHMDFEAASNIREDDNVMAYDGGFKLVCDSKSLLYLFGMELGYSNALIGGGFIFANPNSTASCGCGKSFSA